ncbi:BamA/TamA family outer membrane protein [Pedobacter sp. SD-b]|uniref:BamA/TamA family outer membrane protein n=1 Tax=Pedobacter segetis TaxID=2793069 RepID=A0ABS1BIF7_9SPHI|nr:BamA/TamA family outer membrane protein [Pedobacter segetis]MBK0382649.1 BamA/TamA family outer membrane protein [Pedobacter segetis]
MKFKQIIYTITLAVFIASCSNTKYLPKGELLYVGAKIKIEGDSVTKREKSILDAELESILRPRPNSSILGLRPKLYIYNITKTDKKKGLKHYLNTKLGQAPVYFSKVDLDYNVKLIENRLDNRGYFKGKAIADSTSKNKRATAIYTVTPNFQYKIRNVKYPTDSSKLGKAITALKESSYFKPGEPYDLDKIKAERTRIDAKLKEQGFFYFGPDYLLAQVDSTVGKHQVDIILKVKNQTPQQAANVYTIGNIYVYPDYSLRKDSAQKNLDSATVYKDLIIEDPKKKFKPQIFDRALQFNKGDIYNRTNHNLSLNRLVNVGAFKFVKNEFKPSDSLKSALDAYYYLTPLPKKSIRLELLGKTNSANYTGSEINLNWTNRNAFRGAEQLTVTAFGGIETQVSGQNSGYNVLRFGGDASLTWPKFITPFVHFNSVGAYTPKTVATLGFEYQNRAKLYSLNTFRGSFGYLWKENTRKEHQLKLTEITYTNSSNISAEYQAQADTVPSLQRVIDKQLIFGPSYSYTYTTTAEAQRKNTVYYKGQVDLAGTLAGLINKGDVLNGDTSRIFQVPFSQYAKVESDFRDYLKIGYKSTIATRIIAGIGLPYGNSGQLPFIKQFFIGGTNSLRGFRARSIGPGTFKENVDASSFLPDQSGDIKLELNAEYRYDFTSIFKGAIFTDAGNIWLLNADAGKPGAKFSNQFLSELAVDAGAGLRLDLSFLILRLDLAFPLRQPYLPKGDRWVINDIRFGDKAWRKQNLVFNLAIGYPF